MKASNLFANRKARNAKDLARKGVCSTQMPKRILIVCEGQKTEPYYFEGLKQHYRDHLKAIIVQPSNGSAPISNVETAERLYREDLASVTNDTELAFEAVYCVFDRDTHRSFDAAIAKIAALKVVNLPIYAMVSYPCFEFWLILHFEYTRAPFNVKGKVSVGNTVVKKLRTFKDFSDYEKGGRNAYLLTRKNIADGIKNSKLAVNDARLCGVKCPSTHVHELIEILLNAVLEPLQLSLSLARKEKRSSNSIAPVVTQINAIETILGKAKTT